MLTSSTLILTAQSTVPSTTPWNPSVAIVMILCNVFAIIIGYFAIQKTGVGPDLPVPQLASRKNLAFPNFWQR